MKKAKNQTLAETEVKAAENAKAVKNSHEKAPSDKIRSKDTPDGELGFKKVLYGYDPEEVASYIDELNKTYTAATRNYESRLSSIKEELRISNRERDSYSEKYKNSKAELENAKQVVPEKVIIDDNGSNEEYDRTIAVLKEKLEQIQAENGALKEKLAVLERENSQIPALAQKCDSLFADYKDATAQLEAAKSDNVKYETELQIAKQGLEEKTFEFIELSAQADEDKKKAAEFEIKNGILARQIEENESEILRLKEMNKNQAYEYADKVGQLESEHTRSKLALQRELKLQDYYISQAEQTLSELTKQMEQIKQSFSESRSE